MRGHEQISEFDMPASIIPVAVLSGTDYDMGFQYGQQAVHHIPMRLDEIWAQALSHYSYEEILHELQESQRHVREYAPEAIDMMKGIAHGATASGYRMSYFDVLLLNSALRGPLSEEEQLASAGCSGFSAWGSVTKDGNLICGDSADAKMNPNLAIVAFPDRGSNYIALTFIVGALITHPGINDKGLAYVHHGGGPLRPSRRGLPTSIAPLHTLRFASNANEAKEMQLSYVTPSGGQWVDISGNNWVIEFNEAKAARQAGDFGETDFIYSTNNALRKDLGQEGEEYVEHGGWYQKGRWGRCSIPRNLEIWHMLHNYRGDLDLDFVEMMWRFPGNPPTGTKDPKAYIETNSRGWDQMICHLMNEYVTIMQPDDGDGGKMYVCAGSAGRIAHPVDPAGYSFRIAPTNTFYELTLASTPDKVVNAAKVAANANIAQAYEKLMMLNYRDPGYAALDKLLSVSKGEYYQGSMDHTSGLLTGGNEALLHFSKAATAFARAQAHAKQVFYAMAPPPPTSPEELKGLKDKPWFGDWGDWAERH
jgi:hypothetical protein